MPLFRHFARPTMVSATQQFERIRKRKKTTSGKRNKRERRALGTPAFAIHPEAWHRPYARAVTSGRKQTPTESSSSPMARGPVLVRTTDMRRAAWLRVLIE